MKSAKLNSGKGFTLIEMMIVVGIVLIIAVIAIPAMIRSKSIGNETSAIASVRTISNAANLYVFQNNDFPPDLNALAAANLPYISFSLASTSQSTPKDGYYYIYTLANNGFKVVARPSRWQVTGSRCFSADEKGKVLYCNDTENCVPDQDL
jgi:prepilin-type N-terminal cleavage/methylation domain-containing protein